MNSPDLNEADLEMIDRLRMADLAIELNNGRVTGIIVERPKEIQVMRFMQEAKEIDVKR